MLVTFGQYIHHVPFGTTEAVQKHTPMFLSENGEKIQKGLDELYTTAKAILPERGRQFRHIRKQINFDPYQRPSGVEQLDTIKFTIQPSTRDSTPDERVLKVTYCVQDDPDVSFATMPRRGATDYILEQLKSERLIKEISQEWSKFNRELDPSINPIDE